MLLLIAGCVSPIKGRMATFLFTSASELPQRNGITDVTCRILKRHRATAGSSPDGKME